MSPALAPAVLTEPATLPRSAPVWGEVARDPVLRPSESAVSSPSLAGEQPVKMGPMP